LNFTLIFFIIFVEKLNREIRLGVRLQETFKLLQASCDNELSWASRWNETAYMHYDVIAGEHVFTSANDAPINDVTRGFPLTSHSGAVFTFSEQVGRPIQSALL